MSIAKAERKQDEFDAVLDALSKYNAKREKYIEVKNKLFNNAKKFYKRREKIIEGFKNRISPMIYDVADEQARYEKEQQEEINNVKNENGSIDYERLARLIDFKSRDINDELVKRRFIVQDLGKLLKKLRKLKHNPERNKIQVSLINSGLRDLKEEIEDMSEQEKRTKTPNEIVDIVENILEFNRQQEGQGLKILTRNQMHNRLPISLAQLKAGNNSAKLKNEIRQLLYSLYRSQKLAKQLYQSLIGII